jgi:hypothetical protein
VRSAASIGEGSSWWFDGPASRGSSRVHRVGAQ